MIRKIRNKSKSFHKHGKHKSVLMEIRNLQKKKKHKSEFKKPKELFKEIK